MQHIKKQSGYTLMEVMLVVVMVSILAVVAVPRIFDVVTDAKKKQRDAIVDTLRDNINRNYSRIKVSTGTGVYTALDTAANGACTVANPCFGNVLKNPLTDNWHKGPAVGAYTHDPTMTTFTYDVNTGRFYCTVGC
jgi:MSHA pilin protein MshA